MTAATMTALHLRWVAATASSAHGMMSSNQFEMDGYNIW